MLGECILHGILHGLKWAKWFCWILSSQRVSAKVWHCKCKCSEAQVDPQSCVAKWCQNAVLFDISWPHWKCCQEGFLAEICPGSAGSSPWNRHRAMLWIVADDDSSSEDSHRASHITGQDHIIKLHDRTLLHWDHRSFKVAKAGTCFDTKWDFNGFHS